MPAQHRCALAALAIALVAVACASASSTHTQETAAESLDRIIADGHRPAADRERDVYRHPQETLLFFGLRPQMEVVEIWPEPGWYTEILAPFLKDQGKYYAALTVPRPDSPYITGRLAAFAARFSAHPESYGNLNITHFGPDDSAIAPPGPADMGGPFPNIHSWMYEGWAPQAFAAMYKALKPGGILGVVEHRGNS